MSAAARQVVSCPQCGAPLPPAAEHEAVECAFCKTTSAPAKGEAKLATASELECPRCRALLYEGRASDVVMLGCGLCGGIWLDNASATRALASVDGAVVSLARTAEVRTKNSPDRRPRIACAVCKAPAGRVPVTRLAIEVDTCNEHGTWFDRGELATILDAMRRPLAPGPVVIDARPLDPAEIPDFRAGQGMDYAEAGLIAGGVFTVLGALVSIAGDRK